LAVSSFSIIVVLFWCSIHLIKSKEIVLLPTLFWFCMSNKWKKTKFECFRDPQWRKIEKEHFLIISDVRIGKTSIVKLDSLIQLSI
jgi:hypothetical protein